MITIPDSVKNNLVKIYKNIKGKRILLYPAGTLVTEIYFSGILHELNIVGIMDGDDRKQGQAIGEFKVTHLSQLSQIQPDIILVISTTSHKNIMYSLGPIALRQNIELIDLCYDLSRPSSWLENSEDHDIIIDDSISIIKPGIKNKILKINRKHEYMVNFIVNNFDMFFEAVEPTMKNDTSICVDYSHSSYKTIQPSGLRFCLPSIYEGEEIVKRYVDWGQIKEGDVVLDLGAYAGDSTYFFSKAVGTSGIVIAVEPDSENFNALKTNIAIHNLKNVIICNCAIWDSDGMVAFDKDGSIGSGIVDTLDKYPENSVMVTTRTLESILKQHGIEKLDCIKMDIEGAEIHVLSQSIEILKKFHPTIIVGPHAFIDRNETIVAHDGTTAPEVKRILTEAGYQVTTVGTTDPNILAYWPK